MVKGKNFKPKIKALKKFGHICQPMVLKLIKKTYVTFKATSIKKWENQYFVLML